MKVPIEQSSWVAVRCFEKHPGDRIRFAHTAPVHLEIPGKPLRPRPAEVQYFIDRMEQEIERNKGVLSAVELKEYQDALEHYRRIAKTGAVEPQ
ncbi:MAG: hypothetical protein A2V70_14245 [Planctomycetes bacterium RBG_13_63_9]|nr:MAG: hypothetical protein A2V70_14245 [Planctomycetes bacterium RBG_13_63_9]